MCFRLQHSKIWMLYGRKKPSENRPKNKKFLSQLKMAQNQPQEQENKSVCKFLIVLSNCSNLREREKERLSEKQKEGQGQCASADVCAYNSLQSTSARICFIGTVSSSCASSNESGQLQLLDLVRSVSIPNSFTDARGDVKKKMHVRHRPQQMDEVFVKTSKSFVDAREDYPPQCNGSRTGRTGRLLPRVRTLMHAETVESEVTPVALVRLLR